MPGKPTILIVDDEAGIRRMISEVLTLEGYPIETAANGREALDLLKSSGPRVILLDLSMPVLDGEGFLRELEAVPSDRKKHKVILVSAFLGTPKFQHVQGDGRLPKPFTAEQLINVIDAVGVPA